MKKSFLLHLLIAWGTCTECVFGQWGVSDGECWQANTLYSITNQGIVIVPPGATLTIEPGTKVQFSNDSKLIVGDGGTCIAKGVEFTHCCDQSDTTYTIAGTIITDDETVWPAHAKRYEPVVQFVRAEGGAKFGDTQWAMEAPMMTTVLFWTESSQEWVSCSKTRRGWDSTAYNRVLSAGEIFLEAQMSGGPGGKSAVAKIPLTPSFPMILQAESADWTSGTITLQCVDGDASASTHKYSLEYCNESGEWVAIDGAKDIPAIKSQDSAGQEVWIAKLTDPSFSSRLGGLPPVSYRVTDETGRVSEPCVTRTKYGIFVSPGGYASGVDLVAFPSATPNYAETFGRLATSLGSFAKVHVLTGSRAVYAGIDGAFKDIASTIKCGDVCFLYFGTHGGLHPNSTSSCLVLYDGTDYEENALATHVKLLNGIDASNPTGNGVAIVGFVHACHSKGISDNTDDEYCRVGSWCVNSVLTSKNSAWITATDDAKALSLGDYFSLFLVNYGWEKGWSGNSGEPLSCEKLADYTKKRTDALFDGLTMKAGGVSYSIKVGVFGASSMLRNIMIGKCGNHDNIDTPSDPEEMSAQGINTSTIQVRAKNIRNADRTVLFKRKGEDATWDSMYRENLAGTFTYDDTDVASSGRELPYYYQIRTLNGAGIGKSTVASAWRVHTESHKVTFMYELPQTVQSASAGIWWELPYDSTLSGIWNELEKSVEDLGVNGFVHTGWFTEHNGRGSRITGETRVFKPVTYYANWTAMTQAWLDSHPTTASAANGDIATAASMTAANGCRTVGECYALGINPDDPNDDLRISQFEMQEGKPHLTLNHTEDGSGKTFLPDVRVLGTTALGESSQWDDVTDIANPDASGYRFFKATVELP